MTVVLEGQGHARSRTARGAAADRVDHDEHGPLRFAADRVDVVRCPQTLKPDGHQLVPHRLNGVYVIHRCPRALLSQHFHGPPLLRHPPWGAARGAPRFSSVWSDSFRVSGLIPRCHIRSPSCASHRRVRTGLPVRRAAVRRGSRWTPPPSRRSLCGGDNLDYQ